MSNRLGCGFHEKVYEHAWLHELCKSGFRAEQLRLIKVVYDGMAVGYFLADLRVEDAVLVELKTIKVLNDINFAQCMKYLKAVGICVGQFINFGKRGLTPSASPTGLDSVASTNQERHRRSSAVHSTCG